MRTRTRFTLSLLVVLPSLCASHGGLAEPLVRERLCRRAELDFGLSLPLELGGPVIERARASLELSDEDVAPSIDWAEAQRRQDAIDRAAMQGSDPRAR